MISTLPIYEPDESLKTLDLSSRQSSDWENARRKNLAFQQKLSRKIPFRSQMTSQTQVTINPEFQVFVENIEEFGYRKTPENSEEILSHTPFPLIFLNWPKNTLSFPFFKNNFIIYLYTHYSSKDYFVEAAVFELLKNKGIPVLVIDQLARLTKSALGDIKNLRFCLYHDPEIEIEPKIRIEVTVATTIEHAVRQNECWHERLVSEFPKDIFSNVCLNMDLMEK